MCLFVLSLPRALGLNRHPVSAALSLSGSSMPPQHARYCPRGRQQRKASRLCRHSSPRFQELDATVWEGRLCFLLSLRLCESVGQTGRQFPSLSPRCDGPPLPCLVAVQQHSAPPAIPPPPTGPRRAEPSPQTPRCRASAQRVRPDPGAAPPPSLTATGKAPGAVSLQPVSVC